MHKPFSPRGIQPPGNDQVIFRYMSFGKFVSLVESRSIYFPCIQKLKNQDKLEGLIDLTNTPFCGGPQESVMLDQIRKKLGEQNWKALGNPDDLSFLLKAIAESGHNNFFVSCWHMAKHESILMWNRYAPGYESVAIQTTVGKLIASIQQNLTLRYGIVRYDPKSISVEYDTGSECFYKDPLYIGESECRFMAYSNDPGCLGVGMLVPSDLSTMIDRIYVAPDSESWFLSLVKSIASKAGLPTQPIRTITKK